MHADQEKLMREAIRLSRESMADGQGGPFGAVIVRNGEVVSTGQNRVVRDADPTAHAEMMAIREACKKLNTHSLEGCEIYSTCEPCPMCLGAIYWARLDRVYYACTRDDAASAGFDDSLFYYEVAMPKEQRRTPLEQILPEEAVRRLREREGRRVFLQGPRLLPVVHRQENGRHFRETGR
jgi:guanine deaminase